MSIPLDRLYHYIESIAKEIRGDDVLIYRFFPHGSKNINDLNCTKNHTVDQNIYVLFQATLLKSTQLFWVSWHTC